MIDLEMASMQILHIFLICLSLSVLFITSWLILSGNGLISGRAQSCSCKREFDDNKNEKEVNDGLEGIENDPDPPAQDLVQCKEKMKTCKERLDWEISRNDWKEATLKVASQESEKRCADFQNVNLLINGKKRIDAIIKNDEVFVPFSVLREEFEIHGEFNEEGVFEWRHAIIRPWEIPEGYEPEGEYVGLGNAIVENRKRVKCVDGVNGVPVTTQWDKNGYFYATQIAQYGLAHYNQFLKKGGIEKRFVLHEGNQNGLFESGNVKKVHSEDKGGDFTYFNGKASFQKSLLINQTKGRNVLSMEVNLNLGSTIVIKVRSSDSEYFFIKYVENGDFISCSNPNVQISLGDFNGWRNITRNVEIDFLKGISLCKKFKGNVPKFDGIRRLMFIGSGYIGKIEASSSAHAEMFLSASKWLLKFQDKQGGWSVNVTRKIIPEVVSPPGWRSAMGSGQAISLLCRAYAYTKQPIYLKAAISALKLFKVPVSKNGFVSTVMGDLKMFEEYPANPSLHVLNGFIFSLIGLYDLSKTDENNDLAKQLFDNGIRTLLKILPMYDNGSGTFYDLRHIVIPGVEPKRARWDYHAVHLGQLELLNLIKPNPIFDKILLRWKKYVNGVPARHN